MNSNGPQSRYRADIDGLRAIAVTSVVIFHAFPRFAPGGFVGVDIFFVISGFLISSIIIQRIQQARFSYRDFYARRIRRIFPALLTVFVSSLAAGWFLQTPSEYEQLGKQVAGGALFASNFVLWMEAGYFDLSAQLKPFLHLWSLGVEEQFYLLWPVVLVRFWRKPAAIAFLGAVSFVANILFVETHPSAVFYSPLTRFWELLVGAVLSQLSTLETPTSGFLSHLVALFQSIAVRKRLASLLSIVGLAAIGLSVINLREEAVFPGWWACLPVLGTAMVVSAGPEAIANRRLLSQPPLVLIGLISYPLYLWHWPILVFLRQADLVGLSVESRWVRLAAVAVSVGAAYVTYRVIELRLRWTPRATPALCLLMCAVLASSLTIVATRGVPWRWSADQNRVTEEAERSLASSADDYQTGVCNLRAEQNASQFGATCGGDLVDHRPTILLWGDSHAAHLVPGLRSFLSNRDVNLAQLTANGCPPLLGYSSKSVPECARVNRYVLEWVRTNRPRAVILSANWLIYSTYSEIDITLQELHKLGIKQVAVVGPVATFPKPQPEVLIRHARDGLLPERIATPLMPELLAIDSTLRRVTAEMGYAYRSPLESTCNVDGCLVALLGRPELLLSFDKGHLTRTGSDFVVRTAVCVNRSDCGGILEQR